MTGLQTFECDMAQFRREELLLGPVARYLRRRTFRRQQPEVPFFEYRIDLFAFSHRHDLTLAIELKLSRWRRAFEQALLYQLGVDLTLIAVPRTVSSRVDTDLLREHGVGLIVVGSAGRCEEIVTATRSRLVRPHYRRQLLQLLDGSHV